MSENLCKSSRKRMMRTELCKCPDSVGDLLRVAIRGPVTHGLGNRPQHGRARIKLHSKPTPSGLLTAGISGHGFLLRAAFIAIPKHTPQSLPVPDLQSCICPDEVSKVLPTEGCRFQACQSTCHLACYIIHQCLHRGIVSYLSYLWPV
jgi:hypothetical protein